MCVDEDLGVPGVGQWLGCGPTGADTGSPGLYTHAHPTTLGVFTIASNVCMALPEMTFCLICGTIRAGIETLKVWDGLVSHNGV